MNVTCDPRATVSVVGQTALLTMRIVRVSGNVEQVMPFEGPIPPLALFPPHATAVAALNAAATAASNRVRVTRMIFPLVARPAYRRAAADGSNASKELARDVEAQIPVVFNGS